MSKTKELLKRFKGMVQCNYKELANGNFDDSTRNVLVNLQAEENSESEEGYSSKTRWKDVFKDRQLQLECSLKIFSVLLYNIRLLIIWN